MPRPGKGARIYKRKRPNGRIDFYIRDTGVSDIPTGFSGEENRQNAEKALAQYIASKNQDLSKNDRDRDLSSVTVGALLVFYADNAIDKLTSPERALFAIKALLPFWNDKLLSEIDEETCEEFVLQSDNSESTCKRNLGVLRSALNYVHRKRLISSAPHVFTPKESNPNPEYFTYQEFGKIIWKLYFGHRKRGPDGKLTLKGRTRKTRHAAKIALCQFYTGSRSMTVAETTFEPRADGPYVDLKNGTWWRAGPNEPETIKRRRPHKIPSKLLSHLRRWERNRAPGQKYIVEHPRYPGKPVKTIRKALQAAAREIGIATPENGRKINQHTLKHTAITLAIQSGMSVEDASSYFSTSPETIINTYWHHSPDQHKKQVDIMDNLRKRTS